MRDGTVLGVVSLDLIRYTVHPYGVECDAWPPALDQALKAEESIIGWEVWCEATDMRPRRSA